MRIAVLLPLGSPLYNLNAVYTAVSVPLPTFTALKVNLQKILKPFQHVFFRVENGAILLLSLKNKIEQHQIVNETCFVVQER